MDMGALEADTMLLLQAKQKQQNGSPVPERTKTSDSRSRFENLHQEHQARADSPECSTHRETANADEFSEGKGS